MEKTKKNEKNLMSLAIGFFLIILAATLIFARQQSAKKMIEKKDGVLETSERLATGKSISSSELAMKILSEKDDLIIFDLRNQAEFDQEHIQNSKNVRPDKLGDLAKDKTYIIVAEGISAEEIASLREAFSRKEIDDYFFLSGGFSAWKSGYNPTISAGNSNSPADQAKVTYLTSDELKTRMATEKNLLVVDLRKKDRFEAGHIQNAINIPLDNLEKEKSKITLGKKVILYSDDGLEAFQAAVRLYDLGVFSALALSDGFDEWKKKGFEVVK